MALSNEAKKRIDRLKAQNSSMRNASNPGTSSNSFDNDSSSDTRKDSSVGSTLSDAARKRIDRLKEESSNGSLRYSSQIVDNDYISSFVSDANNFVNKYRSAYDSLDYKSATGDKFGGYYDSLVSAEKDLNKRAHYIREYMSTHRDQFDDETYKGLSSYVDSFSELSTAKAFKGKSDYYSQFETEEDYQTALRYDGYSQKYKGYTAEEIQKALDTLGVSEERDWLRFKQGDVFGDTIRGNEDFQNYADMGSSLNYDDFGTATRHRGKSRRQSSYTSIDKYRAASLALAEHYGNEAPLGTYGQYDEQVAVFRTMDDKEFENLAYCISYDKEHGTNMAEQYVDFMEETLSERRGTDIGEKVTSIDIPVIEDLAVLGYGALAGVNNFAFGVEQFMSDEELAHYPSTYANAYISDSLDGFGYYAHSAATNIGNMAPSILASSVLSGLGVPGKVAEGVGSATMGVSAAGSAYKDALSQGYDKNTARTYSNLIGASEGLLQYLIGGVSKLGGMNSKVAGKIAAIDNALLRGSARLGVSLFSETLEEEAQNFLEPALRMIIFGEDYDAPTIDEIIETALVTMLSTGVLEAGGTISETRAESKLNRQAIDKYGEYTKELIDEGLLSDKNSESYKLAQKYQQQVQGKDGKGGKDLTGYQIRNLVQANEAQFAVEDFDSAVSTAKERLTELGENKDVNKLAKLVAKRVSGQELTRAEKSTLARSQYGAKVAKEMTTPAAETSSKPYSIKYKSITERVGEEGRYGVSESGQTNLRNENEAIAIAEVSYVKDGQMTVKLEDGREVYAGDIDFANDSESHLYSAIADMENITPAAATALVKAYDPVSQQTVGEYVNGIDEAYTYGYHGYSEADLKAGQYVTNLSNEQMMSAYKLGQSARAISNETHDAPLVQMRTAAEAKLTKKQQTAQLKTQFASDDVEVYFEDGANVVKFDEHNAGQYDEKRMAGVNAAKFLSKMGLGGKYFFYESYENADGVRVYKDAKGNEVNAPNGIYKSSDGSIHIDMNAGDNGDGTTVYTLGHESTHFVKQHSAKQFKVLADLVTEAYSKTDMTMHERVVEKQNRLSEIRGEHVSYDEAFEEVVADAMSTMFSDGNIYEKLTELKTKDRGLFNTIKKFFENLISKFKEIYASLTPDQKDAQDIQQMKDMFDRIQDAFAKALVEASDNFRASEQVLAEAGITVNDKTNSGSLQSVRDVLNETERNKVAKALAERFGVTTQEAKNWLKAETSLASLILNPKYSQFLDYEADPNEVAIKQNSDYPQGTVDFSNICKKRREFTQVMNRILRNFPNHVFAATDLAKIRTIMGEEGMTLPCGICYVEDRRQLDTIVAQDFINGLKLYREGSKTRPDGKPFNANQLKGLQLTDGDTYVPTIYELVSLEGRNSLKAKNPNMEAAWVKYNNARGMQAVRLLTNEAEYKRQILKYNKNTVKSKNDRGGLRIYSFSDAEMFHLIDIIQVITDSATVGLAIQGYTKVNEYAKAVKDTGEKLNRSLIPKGDLGYHIENGKVVLDYDTVEGIDIYSKDFFDNKDNPNVGNITIGINDVQIRAAMVSDFVDQIIPFHTGQSEEVLGEKGIAAWDNYKDYQTEKDIATGKTSDHQINIYTEVFQAAEEEGNPIQNKRQFVEKFLQVCKENGLQPRFSQFLNTDANGDYVYTEGYHKFLVDFKTFAQTEVGEYLPQMPVKPIFDDAYITGLLESYVEEQKAKDAEVAKQMPKVIERITNEIVKPSDEKRSDRYGGIREVLAKRGLDELSKKFGSSFPLSASFDATMRANSTPLVMETVQANQVKRKPKESAFKAGKQAFTRSYGAKTTVHIKQMGIDAELFPSVAGESISKALGRPDEQSTLDVIPHISDILSNSIFMGIERIAHTDNKGTALYGYRLYNLYWYQNGNKKTPNCLVCTVVQDLDKAEGYVFQNIENVTVGHGLPGNNTGMPKPSSGNTYNVSQLYQTVKKIDRSNGGLKYTDAERDKYLFPYTERNDGAKYSERDSAGKQLTKEQQEFFKYSAVRDADGNLMVMYHGTANGGAFTVFDGDQLGNEARTSQVGQGFYFTNAKAEAKSYTTNVDIYGRSSKGKNPYLHEVYLNITNPFNIVEDTLNMDDVKAVYGDGTYDYFFENWIPFYMNRKSVNGEVLTKAAVQAMSKEEKVSLYVDYLAQLGTKELLSNMVRAFPYGKQSELLNAMRNRLGYDGIVEEYAPGKYQYVAFTSEQIKSVDNQNPTSDPDIRYSERTSIGYHAGDLGKSEGHHMQGGGRSTGHFGTGTYFVSNPKALEGYNSRNGKPAPVETVDFDNYNLYRIYSDEVGYKLHRNLQVLDGGVTQEFLDAAKRGDYRASDLWRKANELADSYDNEVWNEDLGDFYSEDYFGAHIRAYTETLQENGVEFQTFEEWYYEYSGESPTEGVYEEYQIDYYDYLKDTLENADEDRNADYPGFRDAYTDLWLRFGKKQTDAALQNVVDHIKKLRPDGEYNYDLEYGQDSNATVFMKSLGYEGINVSGTGLDNTTYGSVIYDLKGEDLERKNAIGTARYSERTGDSVSNRHLLANAFEFLVQNSEEYKLVQEYRDHIKKLNELEAKLHQLNSEIREIRFGTEGRRDADRLYQLESEAKEVAKEINRHDKRLLSLEATEPLRKVIERERKKEAQKTKDHVKQIQQNKKVRAEQAEIRHKIRKAIRDLDKILNRGNKKLNVKQDIQNVVTKALQAADILFTENYSNYDMLRNGIGADLSDSEEALVNTCTRMLKDIDKMPSDGYDSWQARQEAESKLKAKMSKLKDVFARERKRLNNTTVSSILSELADAYASLENSEQSYVQGAYSEPVHNFLKSLQSEVGGTIVSDMTKDQLESVYAAYKMVLTTVRKANQMFNEELKMSREQLGNAVIEEVLKAGGTHGLWTKAEIARNQASWNNTKPVWVANRIGSDTFGKLMNGLFKGQYNFAVDVDEAKQFKLSMDEKYHPRKWDIEKLYHFESSTGKKFSLNLQQIMSLYAFSKREQAYSHLLNGGFVFENNSTVVVDKKLGIKRTYIHKGASSYKVNEATLNGIINSLTAEQKSYVDEMQKYLSEVMGNKGNEVSMQLYGIKMFNEQFYFPLRSSGAYMERAKEAELKKEQGQINLVNSGFTHAVKPQAKNPIILSGFMDVWAEHCNEMSMYHSMVLPMEDFRKVYNYSTVHDENIESASVFQTIQDAYGDAATSYIDQLYRELNAGATVDPRETAFKTRISKFKKAAVMLSASVVVQQFSAIGRAYAVINPKYFIGMKVKSGTKLSSADEMKKYAPVAIIKEMGGFDTGTKGSAKSYIMAEKYGRGERIKGLMTDEQYRGDFMGYAPAKADELTWCAIWEAAKRETKAKHPKMDVKSEEFLKLAGEKFSEVIEKTQVYDSVLARSANMRSKGALMSMATAFMAEPTTTINLIEDAIRSRSAKNIAKAFGAVAASIVLNNALASVVYAMRDDDEDETFIEKYLQSFASGMIDDINPMSYYPFLKDVYSLFQGYDVERADMSVIADVRDALKKAITVIGKDTSEMEDDELVEYYKEVNSVLMSLLDAGCSMFGVPLKNVRRDVNGMLNAYKTIQEDINNRDTSWNTILDKIGAAVKDTVPIYAWTKDKPKADKLYDAIIGEDQTYLGRIKSTYKTDNAYESAVRKVLRENDPRIQEAAAAKASGNTAEYNRITKEIIGENHFDSKTVEMAVSSEVAAMNADLRENDQRIKEAAIAWNANDLDEYMRIAKEIISEKLFSQDNVVTAIRSVANSLLPDDGTSSSGREDSLFTAEKFAVAIAQGDQATARAAKEDIILTAQKNGKTADEAEKNFIKSSKTQLKEQFLAGSLSEYNAINALTTYCDETMDDADKLVGEWAFEKRYGFTYDDRGDAYKSGAISAYELQDILINVGGKTEEEAAWQVKVYDWQNEGFDIDSNQKTVVEDYETYCEPAGIDKRTYFDAYLFYADAGEEGVKYSKTIECMPYINSLPLTSAQKTRLAMCWWAESTVRKYKTW